MPCEKGCCRIDTDGKILTYVERTFLFEDVLNIEKRLDDSPIVVYAAKILPPTTWCMLVDLSRRRDRDVVRVLRINWNEDVGSIKKH